MFYHKSFPIISYIYPYKIFKFILLQFLEYTFLEIQFLNEL